jgi:predicted XRE-type DNA-binding protein
MVLPKKARANRDRSPTGLQRGRVYSDRSRQSRSRTKGSRVGDDLVEAFEEMARYLRGEIELKAHELPGNSTTPAQIPAHEVGSGNIFADLDLPNAEEHQLKAALIVQLHRLIKARKLTQTAAAKLIGIKQPDLSKILRGHYQGFSVERLMRMLTVLDQDVEITTRPHRKIGEAGRIIFTPRAV